MPSSPSEPAAYDGAWWAWHHAQLLGLDTTAPAQRPCDTCSGAIDGRCNIAAANQPIVTESTVNGVWTAHIAIRDAGTRTPQHSHAFDHLTVLAHGAVRVSRSDADPVEYTAPADILIPARVKHLFETLTPDVALVCVHNTALTGRVEITEEHQIVEAA